MRKKSLTPDQNGQIWVNIGWKLTKSGKRSQAKVSLGDSLKDAERRHSSLGYVSPAEFERQLGARK